MLLRPFSRRRVLLRW